MALLRAADAFAAVVTHARLSRLVDETGVRPLSEDLEREREGGGDSRDEEGERGDEQGEGVETHREGSWVGRMSLGLGKRGRGGLQAFQEKEEG